MIDTLHFLFKQFGNPDFLQHLLLPLLVHGLLLSLLVYALGLTLKGTAAPMIGAILIILCCLSTLAYTSQIRKVHTGITQEEMLSEPVQQFKKEGLQQIESLLQQYRWAYFGLAILAGATLIAGMHQTPIGVFLSSLMILGTLLVLVASLWVYYLSLRITDPTLPTPPNQSPDQSQVEPSRSPSSPSYRGGSLQSAGTPSVLG
ncbi:MAG: hypothetical protein AAF555_04730 [Verrucomicrobiota bacterium]